MDYKALAAKILENVGGQENVNRVVHCATRLRFTLCRTQLSISCPSFWPRPALENSNAIREPLWRWRSVFGHHKSCPLCGRLSGSAGPARLYPHSGCLSLIHI